MCAQVALQQPIAGASGRFRSPQTRDGIVITSHRGQLVARSYATPRGPLTSQQEVVRSLVGQSAVAYQGLTAGEGASWRELATQLPRKNALGQTYFPNGIDLFQAVNLYRQLDGQGITSTAPTDRPAFGVYEVLALGVNVGLGELTIGVYTQGIGSKLFFRVSRDLGSAVRKADDSNCRMISEATATNIREVVVNPEGWNFPMDNFTLTPTDHVGLRITVLSPQYLPGRTFVADNVAIT